MISDDWFIGTCARGPCKNKRLKPLEVERIEDVIYLVREDQDNLWKEKAALSENMKDKIRKKE